jgi:DNA-directed RNA polymerase sigma subunit (sigma70/sigma32)
MTKRDPERTERLRTAIRYMLEKGTLAPGSQSRLAEHFDVSRQRVHQIVVEERRYMETRQTPVADPAQQSVRAS